MDCDMGIPYRCVSLVRAPCAPFPCPPFPCAEVSPSPSSPADWARWARARDMPLPATNGCIAKEPDGWWVGGWVEKHNGGWSNVVGDSRSSLL